MLLQMFVNELSLSQLADDIEEAHKRVRNYVLTMRAATASGVQRTLHLPQEFYAIPIAVGYYWQSWLHDKRVQRELQQYFLSLATKVPFLQDDPVVEVHWSEIDCVWKARRALGLKAAYIADGLAVSMLSSAEWDSDLLECEIQEVDGNDIRSTYESIHHASTIRHVDIQRTWIQHRIQSTVGDGMELWERISEFFPSLICCAAVEDQMAELPARSLPSITRGLIRLNAFCLEWQQGPFDPRRIDCAVSPDSAATLEQYGSERTFPRPDGTNHTFSWHAKVGRWRIYFDYSAGPGHLIIGYVGMHLRTVKYN